MASTANLGQRRPRVGASILVSLALLLEAGSALAEGRPRIDCKCRANGRSFELGERVCLQTASGYRLAECRMVQNVTSWRVEAEGCLVSELWLAEAGG